MEWNPQKSSDFLSIFVDFMMDIVNLFCFVWESVFRITFLSELCNVFNWELDLSKQNTEQIVLNTGLSISVCLDLFIQFIKKSFTVWGEIFGFTCKSLDKSSDFTDFNKSMDLSDLSEYLNFSIAYSSICQIWEKLSKLSEFYIGLFGMLNSKTEWSHFGICFIFALRGGSIPTS